MPVPVAILAAFLTAAAGAAPLVAVDVGHYRAEPGAISARGRPELEFNRDLAIELARALAARGLDVRLIGADGDMAVLSRRTAAAREAALFVSVHHDSVQPHYLEEWEHEGAVRKFSDRFAGFSLFVSPQRSSSTASRAHPRSGAVRAQEFAVALPPADPRRVKPVADRATASPTNLVVLHSAAACSPGRGDREPGRAALRPTTRRLVAAAVARVRRCLRPEPFDPHRPRVESRGFWGSSTTDNEKRQG
jgi:N-acetylmuramoyl-L-alanine amidase